MPGVNLFHPITGLTWRATVGAVVVPGWPVPDGWQAAAWQRWMTAAWANPEVAAAIGFASPDLAQRIGAIVDGHVSQPAVMKRTALALARYLLRMQGRATPFGLFAGVAPVEARTGSSVGADRMRLRAAGEWVAAVIEEIESAPDLLVRLRATRNDMAVVRGRSLYVSWRPHSANRHRGRPQRVSLRYTRPVAVALQAAAQPVAVMDIVCAVHQAFPAADLPVVHNMVAELVNAGALITNLRAPLTTVDAVGHLLQGLGDAEIDGMPPARHLLAELGRIHDDIEASRVAVAGADGRQRTRVADRMRALAGTSTSPLRVDVRLGAAPALPPSVLDAAACAVGMLARLSPAPTGRAEWRTYHARFLDRYGAGALVPLVDLVDPATGLGYLSHYHPAGAPPAPAVDRRDARLLVLAQQAAMNAATEDGRTWSALPGSIRRRGRGRRSQCTHPARR